MSFTCKELHCRKSLNVILLDKVVNPLVRDYAGYTAGLDDLSTGPMKLATILGDYRRDGVSVL